MKIKKMIKKYKEIKEDIKKYRKLRNVHNRVSAVWLALKKHYEQSGCNYGTYESMRFIETTYTINEKHQIYKKFQYHVDEKSDLLKSIVWISEGFDSDKVKNILILSSHLNTLMNAGLVRVDTKNCTISMEMAIPLLVPYLYENEISNLCGKHFNLSRDIVWAYNRLLICDDNPVFIISDLMKKVEKQQHKIQKQNEQYNN